jgi:hypothetical protein
MSEPETLTVPVPGGGSITLPWAQAAGIADCIKKLRDQGKMVTWHPNNCGCCYTVHEDVEHPHEGYVIGKDGGVDWLEIKEDHEPG